MTDFSHDRDPGIVQNQNAFERTNAKSMTQAFRKIHSISQNSDSGIIKSTSAQLRNHCKSILGNHLIVIVSFPMPHLNRMLLM